MNWDIIQSIVFSVIGGLGIFLLGMKNMSEGMQAVAGARLRKMIAAVTDNRIMACSIGALITGIVQSSSVTTVMVIGFVNSGFMTLMQAIGVIFGANVGTTVTAWIIALKLADYGLPILGVAAFFFLFCKKEKLRYTAMTLLGLGMVFFGLTTMGNAFDTPEVNEFLLHVFEKVVADTFPGVIKCAIYGCVATMVVQSSAATIMVTIVLSQNGIMDFNTAAAIVLGLNIGTTITAWLASIGASTNAKRAAYAHIIFNVAGTLWLLPFFFQYVTGIEWLYNRLHSLISQSSEFEASIPAKIALIHSVFNVINLFIFLPLMHWMAKLVEKIVPEKEKDEIGHLTYFDLRTISSPSLSIIQSHKQIFFMANTVEKMMDWLREVFESDEPQDELERKIFHQECILDTVQKEIVVFLSEMISGQVTHTIMTEARKQMRMADEYETLSDYIVDVMKGLIKLRTNNQRISPEGIKELRSLHQEVSNYIRMVNAAERTEDTTILDRAHPDGEQITWQMKEYRDQHLQRVSRGETSPLNSLIFTDMLNFYRRMKDHALNIAEVIVGEK